MAINQWNEWRVTKDGRPLNKMLYEKENVVTCVGNSIANGLVAMPVHVTEIVNSEEMMAVPRRLLNALVLGQFHVQHVLRDARSLINWIEQNDTK